MSNYYLDTHIGDLTVGIDFARKSGIVLDRDYECGSREFRLQYAIQNSSREIIFALIVEVVEQEIFDNILLLVNESIGLLGESEAGRNQKRRLVDIIQAGLKQSPSLGVPEQFREYIPEALLSMR